MIWTGEECLTHFEPLLNLLDEHVSISGEAIDGEDGLVSPAEEENVSTLRFYSRHGERLTNGRLWEHSESGCCNLHSVWYHQQ